MSGPEGRRSRARPKGASLDMVRRPGHDRARWRGEDRSIRAVCLHVDVDVDVDVDVGVGVGVGVDVHADVDVQHDT